MRILRRNSTQTTKSDPASYYEREYRVTKLQYEQFTRYQIWLKNNYPSDALLKQQHAESIEFENKPLFSIILPVYKTPPFLLEACIDSIEAQSYQNWEICLVDDNSGQTNLKQLCKKYKQKHSSKIKYKYRSTNGHISKASNDAAQMASGEFLVLVDHDDLLWPNALFELAKELNRNPKWDFLYTDEDMIETNGLRSHPYIKPEFNRTYLESCNYITHLAAVRTSLFNNIGGFRVGVEGAQDWDLFLRLSTQTSMIKHIPKLAYSWRMIETSTAMSGFEAKPYAHNAQKKAVIDHYRSLGVAIKDAMLHPGYIGWMPTFHIPKTVTLDVVLNNINGQGTLYTAISRVEAASTGNNISVRYIIQGASNQQKLRLMRKFTTKASLHFVKAFTKSMLKADYVLYLRNITDIQGESDWLNSTLGFMELLKFDAVAVSIRLPSHAVISAGILYTSNSEPVRILNGYMEGGDRRLDISLLACRSTEAVDPQAFICKVTAFDQILNGLVRNSNASKKFAVLYVPFIRCFVSPETEYNREHTNADSFSYDVDATSHFWHKDYLAN